MDNFDLNTNGQYPNPDPQFGGGPEPGTEPLPQYENPAQDFKEPLPQYEAPAQDVREPLPQYDVPVQDPYQQAPYQGTGEPLPRYDVPVQDPYSQSYTQPQPAAGSDPQVASLANSAFTKGLIAAILCEFPIGSIIAIFFGGTAQKLAQQAADLAVSLGISAGGKNVAARILGKVARIVGIVMTIFWAVYFLFIIIGGIAGVSYYNYY